MSDAFFQLQKTIAEVGQLQARLIAENQQLHDENKRLRELVKNLEAELKEAAGSAPSAVNPEPICVWRSNLTLKQSGLYHEVFWIRCDGSHVQAVVTDTPCFVCGKPIKFA